MDNDSEQDTAEVSCPARQLSAPADTHIEVDLSTCYPYAPRVVVGVVAPDTVEMTSDELVGLEAVHRAQTAAAAAPASDPSPRIATIYLDQELVPLFDYLNSLVSERRPMILHRGASEPLRVYRRGEPTRFSPRPMEVTVDTFDYVGHDGVPVQPLGFRRQLILSLLQVATVDRWSVRSRAGASATERSRGSLRAPIVFELSVTGGQTRPDGPFYRLGLSARCEVTARWQAVRRQVRVLVERLQDPANLIPREFALEALPSNQTLNMFRISASRALPVNSSPQHPL